MSKQLDTFKSHLEEFASKHKQEIRKSSQFRVQFQEMCATIGVDPLACEKLFEFQQLIWRENRLLLTPPFLFMLCLLAGKGFWSEMLGVGDFYYELGVQIIEVCLALKHRNGGVWFHWKLKQERWIEIFFCSYVVNCVSLIIILAVFFSDFKHHGCLFHLAVPLLRPHYFGWAPP